MPKWSMRGGPGMFLALKSALRGTNINDVSCGGQRGLDLLGCDEIVGFDYDLIGDDTIPTVSANYTDAKTVAAVQQALVKKGYNLGSSGPNSDGVDGIFG